MPETNNMPPVHNLPAELPTDAQKEQTMRDLIEFARASGCEINPAEGMSAGGEAAQPQRD